MNLQLTDSVAIVTGSTKGIGRAMVQGLAEAEIGIELIGAQRGRGIEEIGRRPVIAQAEGGRIGAAEIDVEPSADAVHGVIGVEV